MSDAKTAFVIGLVGWLFIIMSIATYEVYTNWKEIQSNE